MASSVTLAQDNHAPIPAFSSHECAYCRSSILSGERWVREKIYEPLANDAPRYLRYHADLFADDNLSCWEKHQMQLQTAQAALGEGHDDSPPCSAL